MARIARPQCHVVITDGHSYRMRQARTRGGAKINNH
jgi:hypothetical protein